MSLRLALLSVLLPACTGTTGKDDSAPVADTDTDTDTDADTDTDTDADSDTDTDTDVGYAVGTFEWTLGGNTHSDPAATVTYSTSGSRIAYLTVAAQDDATIETLNIRLDDATGLGAVPAGTYTCETAEDFPKANISGSEDLVVYSSGDASTCAVILDADASPGATVTASFTGSIVGNGAYADVSGRFWVTVP